MSKCSLQLYVNENFTSQPSIESSDDLLKNLTSSDCKKRTICNYRDVLENYKEPLHKNCTSKTLNSVDSQKNHPVLRNYLLRHSGSVKAYHKIIKQQEEILNLCREKLAKKFSKSFLSGVKDEDIVRALKIIQDTEEPTSDKIICKILRGIVSDVSKNTSEQNEETISIDQVLKSQYSSISSSSSRRKYSFVFNKLKTLFKKSSRNHSISLSNNYNKQPNRFVYHQNCLFNPIETQFLYPYNNVEEIRNYNNYKPPFYGNFPPPGMGSNPTCACHKNLVKLQNEFEKQQSEIRLINQNLQQCLCLLHDIGDKPQEIKNAPFDSFFANTNFQAYQFGTTENLYGHGHRSHSHIHHKKKPEPKKRGCCGRKRKQTCPHQCIYQPQKHKEHHNKAEHNTKSIHDIGKEPICRSSELDIKKTQHKRRDFCACCQRRRRASTTSVDTYGDEEEKKKTRKKREVGMISEEHSIHALSKHDTTTKKNKMRCSCCRKKPKKDTQKKEHEDHTEHKDHQEKHQKDEKNKSKIKYECDAICPGLLYDQENRAMQATISTQTVPFLAKKILNTLLHPKTSSIVDTHPAGIIELPCIQCTKEVRSTRCHCIKCKPTRSLIDSGFSPLASSNRKSLSNVTSKSKVSGKSKSSIWKSGVNVNKGKTGKKGKKQKVKKVKTKKKGKKKDTTKSEGDKKNKGKCSIFKMCKMICCRGT
ncbi:uncharacterized protein [Onthophagus taurus]|uniref:uncharacterized protein isoform X1 n=1 Tax=Onthophagus taurus TaxID=166361 RepID=UPI0039BDDC44